MKTMMTMAPAALEDPLTFLYGRTVTRETWAERRREMLGQGG